MLKQKLMIAALTALSFMPLAATASTLDPSNTLVNGGSYNMLGSNFFGETFLTADGAGTRSFTFTNYNSVSANIELMVATVSALAEKFTGGVTFSWLSGGASLVVGQAMTNYVGALSHVIAAGTSDTLVVAFGNPEVRTCSRTG